MDDIFCTECGKPCVITGDCKPTREDPGDCGYSSCCNVEWTYQKPECIQCENTDLSQIEYCDDYWECKGARGCYEA